MCSITGQGEKVFVQIRLHQYGTTSVKSLVILNACVRVIYFPPTAKVIRRRSQFIVSSKRLDYKSSSLTTRPRRLMSFNVSCSQVSGSGSLSLLFYHATGIFQKNRDMTSFSDSVCTDKFCLNVFFRLTSRYYVRRE